MNREFSLALKRSIPVMCGFIVLGIAYGLTLYEAGYGWLWAVSSSAIVYAGSMQFVLVGLLSANASLVTIAVTALLVNGRHIFYGLSFIDRFRAQGARYPYMVMSLADETYSLLCANDYPPDMNPMRVDFYIAVLDHMYWVIGSLLGALIGQMITFDMTGVDFSMTALFVVILVDQVRNKKCRLPAAIGMGCALLSLFLLGSSNFLLPALAATVGLVLLLRAPIERIGGEAT